LKEEQMKPVTKSIAKLLAPALLAASCVMHAGAAEPARPAQPMQPAQPADKAPLISQADLLSKLERKDSGVVVLDVRTATEFAAGHVPGARNVSHDELPARLDELAALRDTPVVLYCRSGRRTQLAEDVLRKAGFTKLLHLEGDYQAWEAAKRPVETSP
jgi:phage shock protein E